MSVLTFAPYAFLCYLSPLVTLVLAFISLKKEKLPEEADSAAVYGEAPEELPAPQLTA